MSLQNKLSNSNDYSQFPYVSVPDIYTSYEAELILEGQLSDDPEIIIYLEQWVEYFSQTHQTILFYL